MNPPNGGLPNWVKVVLILLILVNGYLLYRVQSIHHYLGFNWNEGPEARKAWRGLTGNIKANNDDLRDILTQMSRDICKLKDPTANCGGGGTVPAAPPKYPP